MNEPATRRLGLGDLMTLVAATALGFALIRDAVARNIGTVPPHFRTPTLWPRAVLEFLIVLVTNWPLPALWTVAILILSLRRPRPPWRRLARRPGMTAGWAVAVISIFNALLILALCLKLAPFGDRLYAELLLVTGIPVGLGVIIAWLTMILTRQWRPDRSWFDRAGRALGIYWMISVAIGISTVVWLMR